MRRGHIRKSESKRLTRGSCAILQVRVCVRAHERSLRHETKTEYSVVNDVAIFELERKKLAEKAIEKRVPPACRPTERRSARTLDSRALTSCPSCVKIVRLKLLWLSAMRISPLALMPTPMG